MVLAIMVIFLCWRVYQVVNPSEGAAPEDFSPPRSELSEDIETPGRPPDVPPPPPRDDWSMLWRRPPFFWVQPGTGPRTRSGPDDDAIDLELLSIQQRPDGEYTARIRTSSSRKWYREGDPFEAYTLLSIDPDGPCVVIFAENVSKSLEFCIEE